jgi:hydrogenase nickel incorporation protein HypA/HybF
MHELSIVMSIVEIAEAEVRKANARTVERIELVIGQFAGVEMEALEFAWGEGVKNSVLAGARREIQFVPGLSRCPDCQITFPMDHLYEPCPQCGHFFNELVQGKELRVKALSVT